MLSSSLFLSENFTSSVEICIRKEVIGVSENCSSTPERAKISQNSPFTDTVKGSLNDIFSACLKFGSGSCA